MPSFTSGLVILFALTFTANAVMKVHQKTADATFGTRVQALLEEVEAMAKSKDVPDTGKQGEIMDMVTKELIPGLEEERDIAKEDVKAGLAQFDLCNTESEEGQDNSSKFGAGPVTDKRTNHSDCRGREQANHDDRKVKCDKLDKTLSTVQEAPEVPEVRTRRAMVEYVIKKSEEFCGLEPTCNNEADACNNAIKAHEGENELCDAAQANFESAFCQWRTKLHGVCDGASRCYKAAEEAYANLKIRVDKTVTRLKTEYSALEKIKCYLNVWLSDQNQNTANQTHYDECNGKTIDDSPMEVPMADAPPMKECPLTSVAVYPGLTEFFTEEYEAFPDNGKALPVKDYVVKCEDVAIAA